MENQPWQPYEPAQPAVAYPTGKREVIFAFVMLLLGFALCNSVLFAGLNLGASLAAIGCIVCSFIYLVCCGHRPCAYSTSLLGLSIVIAAGFARTDDSFVKFVMTCFLLLGVNLGLCLMTEQNLRSPSSVRALLDAPRAAFRFGFGGMPETFRGLGQAFRRSGSIGQKGGAFLLGICIAVPLLAIMIPLLISADAAFDGLMSLMPEFDLQELFATVLFGGAFACVVYVRGAALHHAQKETPKENPRKGLNPITVNTALGAVCLLYLVYLVSQLAYLAGGFAGILPEGYTLAEYARRGFFEMALLCAANLSVMVFALGLVKQVGKAPLTTRLLCLFVGIVTLFLVATASAKMFLYIGSYGLSRLRVLTQIIMLFLAVTTGVVMVWLFVPELPYMKVVLLTAMVIGTVTLWTDVNTQVARYNVDAYLTGQLDHVDVAYLNSLGSSAVPQLARLAEQAEDAGVAKTAQTYLENQGTGDGDLRQWNYVSCLAEKYIPKEDQ